MATYKLELIPVTPVHIGSGEELPGYSYWLDDFWYVYTIDRVLEALPPAAREEVMAVATQDIMSLAAALAPHDTALKQVAAYVGGYSEMARQKWAEACERRSQALAQRMIHSQDRIYLPGSSLKGWLRTALLFSYMQPLPRLCSANEAKALEAETFAYEERDLGSDPFRFLKISDSDVLRDATDLRLARRYAFHEDEQRWQEQVETLLECTQASLSRLQRADQEITLRATLTIDEHAYNGATADGAKPWRFGVGAILQACRHFAAQNLAAEHNYVAGLPALEGVYTSLQDYAANLPDHATLIRLGFGTGRDSKTINYAQPQPVESVSRVLIDGVWPLGWLELRVLTQEGKPFTPADDLPWSVPTPRTPMRNTRNAEQKRVRALKAQQQAAQRQQAAAAKMQERQSKLAGDFMSLLRHKQGGQTEDGEE